jgi:hypothetical protein
MSKQMAVSVIARYGRINPSYTMRGQSRKYLTPSFRISSSVTFNALLTTHRIYIPFLLTYELGLLNGLAHDSYA